MLPDVQQAISVIADIVDKNGAGSAGYWVMPNVILTLSGARSFCDSVFYSRNAAQRAKWLAGIKQTMLVVEQHLNLRYYIIEDAKNNQGYPYVGYDLVTEQGLEKLSKQTKLLSNDIQIAGKTAKKILADIMENLASNANLQGLSKTNLQHVAFGLMLGCPDVAVVEAAKFWQKEDESPNQENLDEDLIDAKIQGAGFYPCPQPIYAYPRRLITNPEIVAHEQLWSKILKDFYASDFHKNLAKNPAFQKQITALTKY
ncbi:MAG: hypothetical protein ACREGF_05440 [Candidatus Saccharimonadales bacterium]